MNIKKYIEKYIEIDLGEFSFQNVIVYTLILAVRVNVIGLVILVLSRYYCNDLLFPFYSLSIQ